jgi:hypothetical protein
MNGAICGGIMSWSKWLRQSKDDMMATMMCKVRKRVLYRGHYRYKIIDPLGDCYYWEDEEQKG